MIVPVRDSKSLSRAIEKLLSDSERRKAMSVENVKIRKFLSVVDIADIWYEVIEK